MVFGGERFYTDPLHTQCRSNRMSEGEILGLER